jgi:excisionase family DNA binding protein
MKEKQITFEGLPMAVSTLVEDVRQIKALLLENSTKEEGVSILTIEETSEFLHVKKQTLYSYVSKGLIPSHKKGGRRYFLKSEVIDWVKAGNQSSFNLEEEAKRIISKRKGGLK